jgi:DNA-directed RNA polymerase alpha subunit
MSEKEEVLSLEKAFEKQAEIIEEQFEKICRFKKELFFALSKKEACLLEMNKLKRKLKSFGLMCNKCERVLPKDNNYFCPYCGVRVNEPKKEQGIDLLSLPPFILKILKKNNFKKIEELQGKTLQELKGIEGIGSVWAATIKKALSQFN